MRQPRDDFRWDAVFRQGFCPLQGFAHANPAIGWMIPLFGIGDKLQHNLATYARLVNDLGSVAAVGQRSTGLDDDVDNGGELSAHFRYS